MARSVEREGERENNLPCLLQTVYRLCTLPLLLHISKLLLLAPRVQSEGEPLLVKPAAIRCLYVQQRLLESRSSSLWAELDGLVKGVATAMDETELAGQVYVARYGY